MWLTKDIWRAGWMMFCTIGLGTLCAGLLVFIEWWFHRRNKDDKD